MHVDGTVEHPEYLRPAVGAPTTRVVERLAAMEADVRAPDWSTSSLRPGDRPPARPQRASDRCHVG